jgi:hypothetical protein
LRWIRSWWSAQGRKVGDGKTSDEIGRMVVHEAGFHKTHCHGDIRFHAWIPWRVISESTWKICRKDPGGLVLAEIVEAMDCRGDGFSRIALDSDSKNSIKDDQWPCLARDAAR